MHVLTPTAFALFVCLSLISCGGGDLESALETPQEPKQVRLEGCVVDAHDRPLVQAVQASTPEGRTAASTMSDARGVFRMHVPAREVMRIATLPDVDGGVTIMTGHDTTFLGGCLRG
ncbi:MULTISPECIES: hypothetical protein [Burkholderiales]|jgi:hypothetical protein|uniref:hypothetical protein n=1 Tax=Burkholderiales TaxID=80840 RepID=UPI001ADF6CDA|nr:MULTISPECIES: hypothetical protein [Burkholderiales]MBK7531763.1 hypothetical protein [Piscinibacter sp.]QTN24854.1 hypothetical protein HZ992_07710 [Rhizobacter sp. AJA081-3]